MRNSYMLTFPISEYENRVSKVVKYMQQEGINSIILSSDENTFYFSGLKNIVWNSKVSTPGVVVITDDGDMTLITSKGGVDTAMITSCVDDIRCYNDGSYESYAKAIVSILNEKHILNKTVGLEMGNGHKMHFNFKDQQALLTELKDSKLVDAGDVLWKVRGIKSPLEIEIMRKSCSINVKAMQRGFDLLEEGMTERDLYSFIMQEYFRMGAEGMLPLGIRAGKDRYSQGNCPPSDRPIREGEIILVDGGPVYKGYYSDIIREAVFGTPTDYQQEAFDFAREACLLAIEAVKPGVRTCDICKLVDDYMDNSKFKKVNALKNWCGHSIGVGMHEQPMVETANQTIIEPGMVFSIEPYIYEEGVGSLGIEENVLVTENGAEILTVSNNTLMRL